MNKATCSEPARSKLGQEFSTHCVREATHEDITSLVGLERECFTSDRISQRSFKHHIHSQNAKLLVLASDETGCLAYGLVLFHQGTRLARLYSLAVSGKARGRGAAELLISHLEKAAANEERHYMRLEVSKENAPAIALYTKCGYQVFGKYNDYYDDHSDALRMQKRIRQVSAHGIQSKIDWYPQGTEFTCGPAALIMAMSSLDRTYVGSIVEELNIWREATTIFMTSGHGGCHPFGLALAAKRRGFQSSVWINTELPLFIDGVRTEHKKEIMTTVHNDYLRQCGNEAIEIKHEAILIADIKRYLQAGTAVLILVSTFRLDSKKAPHWVIITGVDKDCLFVHDPDLNKKIQTSLDCQNVPIARDDFDRMAQFGSQRIRAAITIKKCIRTKK